MSQLKLAHQERWPKEVMESSGSYKRHDGFNPMQIKDGMIVRLNKNGSIRSVLGKYGEYGKESGVAKKSR